MCVCVYVCMGNHHQPSRDKKENKTTREQSDDERSDRIGREDDTRVLSVPPFSITIHSLYLCFSCICGVGVRAGEGVGVQSLAHLFVYLYLSLSLSLLGNQSYL